MTAELWCGMSPEDAAADEEALRTAVRTVLGDGKFAALDEGSGLVAAHERAIKAAFMDELTGPHVDVLRVAMRYLDRHGRYAFHGNPRNRP